jgi:hypothetical protein
MIRFNGDKDKIRYYKGFKKHFDGDLNLKELEKKKERLLKIEKN